MKLGKNTENGMTQNFDYIFLSCVKKKKNYSCKATELYDSDFFKKALKYAKQFNCKIYILSAKYGVLEENDIIEPYEKTLNNMKVEERKNWGELVLQQLQTKNFNFEANTVFLCGENYRKYIIQNFKNAHTPLKGLGIGKQLQWLKENTLETKGEKYAKINN